jgi:GTPase SAR1 family protein
MDKFITLRTTKEIPEFIDNEYNVVKALKNIVATNGIVCIYGDSGVGKTHLIDYVLRGKKRFDYNTKDHNDELLKLSDAHVVMDDVEVDKSLIERLKEGVKPSRGSLILTARTITKIEFCNCLHIPHPHVSTMVAIGLMRFPNENPNRLEKLAMRVNGNVREFLLSIDFECIRDIFQTPKEFIHRLLSDARTNPREHIGASIPDHGYTWDIVHENYIDAPGIDIVQISEFMSLADCLDTRIYNDNWELTPLFSLVAIIAPAIEINHTLKRECIRPGSAWTKFSNFKMRRIKYQSFQKRNIDLDALSVIRNYPTEQSIEIMKHYKFVPSDIDVMNNLSCGKKFKTREIQSIKKKLV